MSSNEVLIGMGVATPGEGTGKETIQVDIVGETEEELDVLAASETGAYQTDSREDDVHYAEEDVRSMDGGKYKSSLANGEKVRIFGRIQKNINDLNALCEEHYAVVVAHPDSSQHLSFYGSRSLVRKLFQSSLPASLKDGGLQEKTPVYMPVAEIQYETGEEESPESHLYSKVLRLLDLYNFPSKEHFSFKQRGSRKVNNQRPKPEYWPPNVKYVPLLSGHMANILEDDPYALSQYTRRTMILRVLKYVRNHYRTLVNMLAMVDSENDTKNYSSGTNRKSTDYKERRTYTLKRKMVIDPERRTRIDAGTVPTRTWEQIRDQNMDAWSDERRYNLDAKPSPSEDHPMPKLQKVKQESDYEETRTPSTSLEADESTDQQPIQEQQIIQPDDNSDTVFINGVEYTIVASTPAENSYSPNVLMESNYLQHPTASARSQDVLTQQTNDLSEQIGDSGCLVTGSAEMAHCYNTEADTFTAPADLILTPAEDDEHQSEEFHPNISMQSSGVCRLIKTIKYERLDGSPVVQKYVVKTRRNEGS